MLLRRSSLRLAPQPRPPTACKHMRAALALTLSPSPPRRPLPPTAAPLFLPAGADPLLAPVVQTTFSRSALLEAAVAMAESQWPGEDALLHADPRGTYTPDSPFYARVMDAKCVAASLRSLAPSLAPPRSSRPASLVLRLACAAAEPGPPQN